MALKESLDAFSAYWDQRRGVQKMTREEFIKRLKDDVDRFSAYWADGEKQAVDPFQTTNEEPDWFECFVVFMELENS